MKKRLHPPALVLQNYGGNELNIVGQLTATIGRESFICETTVLVQKNAPLDLLIGTDVQAQLGFRFLQDGTDGTAVDLLQGKRWKTTPLDSGEGSEGNPHSLPNSLGLLTGLESDSDSPVPTEMGQRATVHLISAARLPARHVKLIRAQVNDFTGKGTAIFEANSELLTQKGIVIEDSATQPDDNQCITLAVHNNSVLPMTLEAGQVLGDLQAVEVVPVPETREGVIRALTLIEKQQGTHDPGEEQELTAGKDRNTRLMDILKLESSTLTDGESLQMREMLLEYADLFALDPSELSSTGIVQHSIDTGDSPPIRQPARRIPFALRGKVNEMVTDMLQQGVIRRSQSPWASPIVLVAKKDSSTRFCVDYRRLNSETKLDVFPLPRIDDTLDLLSNSRYFTTLDLASGYWQVRMAPDSTEKTAFVTHSGLYEFVVMPFGLCNTPATFQRLMEIVLDGLARDICVVYLDDILIVGATFEEHQRHLRKVLDRLQEAGLRLKPSKCHIARRQVEYLGYVVSEQGITTDPRKIEAVKAISVPSNLKGLRSFLGMASYYRRFIPNFSAVAHPLFALTRKDVEFLWTPTCQQAFETLKRLLTEAPLLAFPNFSADFMLETDASGVGLGAVLAQKQEDGLTRPIAFASRTLQKHEANYGITELEALGVVWAVRHFWHYLYGHRCDVFTDHEALKSLLNTPQPSGKLARWGMASQELDIHIHYRPGKKNANADCLSRYPNIFLSTPDSSTPGVVIAALQEALQPAKGGDSSIGERQCADQELAPIFQYLETGNLPEDKRRAREIALTHSQFEILDGVLYHLESDKTLRLIPPTSDRRKIFDEAHSRVFGAHLREAKLHSQLAKHYWWPRMRSDITAWCRACLTCATHHVGRAVKPPLTPIPVSGPFDRVGVDVIQFTKSYQGNQYAVVFVDYLTKWPEVFAVPDQTSLTIARLLVERLVSRHGVPRELLSDRGAAFLSKLMHEVYNLMGIHKANTTAYHPQTDGLVERFNRTLISMLAKTVEKSGRDWDVQLPYVLFAYRTSLQESTRESPFYLLYGRDPQLPTEEALSPRQSRDLVNLDDYKSQLSIGLSSAWSLAQTQVRKAQQRQKHFHDRHARDPKFVLGERVFVYMPSAKQGKAHKFARPFRGPYRILQLYDNGAEVKLMMTQKRWLYE